MTDNEVEDLLQKSKQLTVYRTCNELYADPEAFYKDAAIKREILNSAKKPQAYEIPADAFYDEKARQKYAEKVLYIQSGLVKGRDYIDATVSNDGKLIFQPITPIKYLEFSLGVVTKEDEK